MGIPNGCIPLHATGLALVAALSLAAPIASAGEPVPPTSGEERLRVTAEAEAGFLTVASHKIQFDKGGSDIDLVSEGGQDNLYAVTRWSLDLSHGRHKAVLLYQPLELRTKNLAPRDLVVDDQTFPKDEPIEILYGFPYYRASYLYDVLASPQTELSLGVSLQLRNATIEFQSGDGERFRSNRDVGPVPILKARLRHTFAGGYWFGAEVDGFYAPVSYINGDDSEVVGAIADARVHAGVPLRDGAEAFLNLRYLGGGAEGISNDSTGPGDGYTSNWLHFFTVTVGFRLNVL